MIFDHPYIRNAESSQVNVRSGRCVILYGAEHTALWTHAEEIMPSCAPESLYNLLVPRIGIFKRAYGTVGSAIR
jgi:predicted oxidoreductase (fatty acid repression mutant protein)